ncbi:hypothetical protein IM25_06505 [Rhodococcus sp. p52]|uniref:hypothetical protein n=1 Tax=Rhodococcus sp. p52 TaxID=935199 RepID=UPI00051A43EF|nr:hypothetical protein [Rhodococcus sp. p52]AOD21315.1 hypothetical protein IM25_06505 [Rhodococcus sp. p52]
MKRAGISGMRPRIYAGTDRVLLEIGHDHYVLTASEAIQMADLLVDATEKLTTTGEHMRDHRRLM